MTEKMTVATETHSVECVESERE
eukprot:COSAG03_NODE_28158_length_222_cov_37.255452_1_plen_22_part_01